MGKQGPCCHCGITSTPLWRNGPHDKPVLCNACGSRWRTKGTLANYFPNHARASTSVEFENSKHNRPDNLPTSKRSKSYYTKVYNEGTPEDRYSTAVYHPYLTCFEDDSRSSSGSALSVSESCAQFGCTDEISDPSPFNVSDVQIPSRKRTKIKRPSLSPIEKLRQDLVSILRQQGSSYLPECSQEVLLFDGEELSYNSEIGLGSVLLKPPIPCKEEESEASSHTPGNKLVNDKLQPFSNESSNSAKEVSCLTSDVTGTEISKLAKRPRDSPSPHPYEGKPFKIPKVEVMGTSGEESVHIQAPSSCSNVLSASSQSLNSGVYIFMGTAQVGAELG